MCGIVGYVGNKQAAEIVFDGLKLLEYRGYDSAGIVSIEGNSFHMHRRRGKLRELEKLLLQEPLSGTIAIGHTRWATHGVPSDQNAHPHMVDDIVIVHNGIIENYLDLKAELLEKGCSFSSETDSEVIGHLISSERRSSDNLLKAVHSSLQKISGSYALAVIERSNENEIIVARRSSPLVIGLGDGENFAASDVPALLGYTKDFIYLADGDIARISAAEVAIYDSELQAQIREPKRIRWSSTMAQKDGHKHFMHKEIFEQPRAISDTLRGRISADKQNIILDDFPIHMLSSEQAERITFIACGTSYHASLIGKHLLEGYARIPSRSELASEFRYANPLIGTNELVIAISQSGETADTLAAVEEARKRGAKVLAITNVMESSISRASDWTVYTHAGPEIGVASTKAFSTQLTILYLLALAAFKQSANFDSELFQELVQQLHHIPILMEQCLQNEEDYLQCATDYLDIKGMLYLGRGLSYPIALEGALKLKEISYIHAEGYPAGEMKHGPIALIEPQMPALVVASGDSITEKLLSNIQEIQARRGSVIATGPRSLKLIPETVDRWLPLPDCHPLLMPLISIIPLQLIAYHIADQVGTDVDQPRNLAKSVTVE